MSAHVKRGEHSIFDLKLFRLLQLSPSFVPPKKVHIDQEKQKELQSVQLVSTAAVQNGVTVLVENLTMNEWKMYLSENHLLT